MKKEELLKPRYKVIADWPEMRYRFKGKPIITLDKQDEDGWFTTNGYYQESFFKMYPHLFKRLEWWEERDEKDMPGYMKIKEDTRGLYGLETFGQLWKKGTILKPIRWIGKSPLITAKEFVLPCFVEPATESEYNEYINQKA